MYTALAGDSDEDVQRALSILRGSESSYVQAWAAFFVSIGLCVYGAEVSAMSDSDKRFFGVCVLFMVSSAFTLAKTYRDRQLSDLLKDQDQSATVYVLRGTDAWAAQVVASFALAVGFSFYSLYFGVKNGDMTGDAGFAICAASFVLITTLSLAKSVRDRADATTLAQVNFRDKRVQYDKIMAVSRGSVGNTVVVIVGLVAAVVTTIGGAFSMDNKVLRMQDKGFVLIAALFMMNTAFHLAKLVRDLGDPALEKELHMPFRFLVVGSFLVALTVGIGGVDMMTIPDSKKRFLINGLFFILASTLYTAKAVRDFTEAEKLDRQRRVTPGI